ncbi:uncharacterized protein LOC144360026 [Saccoglossus kowalevskii]
MSSTIAGTMETKKMKEILEGEVEDPYVKYGLHDGMLGGQSQCSTCWPGHVLLITLNDSPQQSNVADQLRKFLDYHLRPTTLVRIISDFSAVDGNELDNKLENIYQADRIVFICSKKLIKQWGENVQIKKEDNRLYSTDNMFGALILRLEQARIAGHGVFYAVCFDYSDIKVIPEHLRSSISHVHELSVDNPVTLETFYGRLLHRSGKIDEPDVRNIDGCKEGKKLRKIVRKLINVQQLIDHGKNIGFSPSDFQWHCLDILVQDDVITEEESYKISHNPNLIHIKDKVQAVKKLVTVNLKQKPSRVSAKYSKYVELVEIWEQSTKGDGPPCIRNKLVFLQENLTFLNRVVNTLQQKGIITSYVAELIRSERTPQDGAKRLIEELPHSQKAFVEFREALVLDHEHVAKVLNPNAEQENPNIDSSDTDSFSSRRSGDRTNDELQHSDSSSSIQSGDSIESVEPTSDNHEYRDDKEGLNRDGIETRTNRSEFNQIHVESGAPALGTENMRDSPVPSAHDTKIEFNQPYNDDNSTNQQTFLHKYQDGGELPDIVEMNTEKNSSGEKQVQVEETIEKKKKFAGGMKPEMVRNLKCVDVTATTLRTKWNRADDGVTPYRVSYEEYGTGSVSTFTLPGSARQYQFDNLRPGTTYAIAVTVLNGGLESDEASLFMNTLSCPESSDATCEVVEKDTSTSQKFCLKKLGQQVLGKLPVLFNRKKYSENKDNGGAVQFSKLMARENDAEECCQSPNGGNLHSSRSRNPDDDLQADDTDSED